MDSSGNYPNQGRGRSGGGRGRGRGGNYPNQGRGRGGNYQNPANLGGGRGESYQNPANLGGGRGGSYQNQPNQGGGRGWGPSNRGGSYNQPPAPVQQQQWVDRPPVQQAWGRRPPQVQPQFQQQPPAPQQGGRGSAWTGRPWGPPPQPTVQNQTPPPPQPSAGELDVQSLAISEKKPASPASSSSGNIENQIQAIKRPDRGGTLSIRSVRLLVNHFAVTFDPEKTIMHYDVDVKSVSSDGSRPVRRVLKRADMRSIRDKLCSDDPRFQLMQTAYDGEKNIFSAVSLPTGQFKVDVSEGEDARSCSYIFTIKLVSELKLSKLRDYMRGNLCDTPRDILQGMDLVMKENPSRQRITVGRSFFPADYMQDDDLKNGIAAYRGFHQSLKTTLQGLSLCLDYSVLTFRKPLPVLEFLGEYLPQFRGVNDVKRMQREVLSALRGLKVRVVHRRTKQKYTVAGLSDKDTCDDYFDLDDPEGKSPPQRIKIVKYFKDKWNVDIEHQNIPCLELGKSNRSNKVPMEFCVLVEGQRFAKEHLDKDRAVFLKKLTLAPPMVRKKIINEMVQAEDGPYGDVARNFGIGVDVNMSKVVGRVIGAPELKVGGAHAVRVDAEKRQWNLLGKALVDGRSLERWALLDFTDGDRYNRLQTDAFVNNLRGRCRNLGIRMEVPLVRHVTRMNEFSSVNRLENLLNNVVQQAGRIAQGKLQLIVCAMTKKDPGYKFLKWVSETKIGVVTQCCLSSNANKGQDQYLANLCLKINAKLGGSNFELVGKLPLFDTGDHVMFIGADVNHPAPMNAACPSMAAVVGTVNWPAANRYAARVGPQAHRTEKIINFGSMCLDLINTYARINKVKPRRIVVFRDGVSDGQFGMLLDEELLDLKKAIYDDHYQPPITLVVAQKRHQTRLFVENRNDGGASGNVPPGTVVDTKIVHPFDFDFYLCSHYGGLGTSKPTHYYVLWDENGFSSDQLQKLIYDMCFTFARCTKPVSLVPPVYYADLVAYRGRMFQEVAMETSPGSSSTASFDPSFYSLHADLVNIMFFV